MDDGEQVLKGQASLLKVFILLDGPNSREYQQALVASLLLWTHWKEVNHPVWSLFKHNANAFNEDSGEIAFSGLARDIARGGTRLDLAAVSKKLTLQKTISDVCGDFKDDYGCDDFGRERTVKSSSPEVVATIAFSKRLYHIFPKELTVTSTKHVDI